MKSDRRNQFLDVLEKIERIKTEISGSTIPSKMVLDETDLSHRKLEELQRHLYELQKEKVSKFLPMSLDAVYCTNANLALFLFNRMIV